MDLVFAGNQKYVPINGTTFPDLYFRNYVSEKFDINPHDSFLSSEEISNATDIWVSGSFDYSSGITPVCSDLTGIEYFYNLENLHCRNNNLTSLNLCQNTNLKYLDCRRNNLNALDLSNNPNLVELDLEKNSLNELDLSNKSNLLHLDCSYNQITILNISNTPLLEELYCYYNNLSLLDVSSNPNLYELYCDNNSLTEIDLSNNSQLVALDCSWNDITSLDLKNNPDLEEVCCEYNNLDSLIISDNTNLELLWCYCNNLQSLDISGAPNLIDFVCVNNNLTNLYIHPDVNTQFFDWENGNSPELVLTRGKPTPPVVISDDIERFIERIYIIALGRSNVDEEGMINWKNQLVAHEETGGSVARFFCTCQEIINRNLSNDEYVEILYNVFFDRTSDAAGKADWVGRLNSGASRESILDGFINSIEWANICASYGIESGGSALSNIEPNEQTIAFVERLYSRCLGRTGDAEGLHDWSWQIANRRKSATEVAFGFFFSEEFTGFSLSNEEYVERLYQTFMDRDSDEAGRSYWLDRLNNGTNRQDVFFGFADSNEFLGICSSYGIYN